MSAAFSADNATVVTVSGTSPSYGSGDGSVYGWDVATGTQALSHMSLLGAPYSWVASTAVPGEWYLTKSGGNPLLANPLDVDVDATTLVAGTVGLLGADQWAYGDNDLLGFNTIYINSVAGDPNLATTLTADYLMQFDIAYSANASFQGSIANDVFFSPTDVNKVVIATDKGTQIWNSNNPTAALCHLGTSTNNMDLGVEISPDGQRVLTTSLTLGGLGSHKALLYDANTCVAIGAGVIHADLRHAKFSGDGLQVATQSSGAAGSAIVRLWDFDQTSPTFLQEINTFVEPIAQVSLRRKITNIAMAPNSQRILTTGLASSLFDPEWINFNAWFNELDGFGRLIRPDENDNANPYYVDNVSTISGCYTTDVNGDCSGAYLTCAEVGGCINQNVVSQFDIDRGVSTYDPKFDYIKSKLDTLTPEWMTDTYAPIVIN
jgi:hypothetical protein